jgi:crotonobetainyl-CoA:carnitine CoA-transferase CaiB-like acyl-CoA transferase
MPGALSGVRVIDLTHVLNGPFCTLLLGHMGAEVIKVENGAGDRYRHSWLPKNVKRDSYNFIAVNSNKKGINIDLKAPQGKALFRKLVEKSDVLVENFGSGVMERLGLGYDDLKSINPALIYACSRGYGESGPYKHVRANAGTIQAITGWTHEQMRLADKPGILGPGNGDEIAGVSMCVGILAALYEREKSGTGQKIEVSMQEALLGFMVPILHTFFEGRQVSCPPKACADGYFFFHVPDMSDELWKSLVTGLGCPDLAVDRRFATVADRRENYELVEEAVGKMAKNRTRAELWTILSSLGLSSAPVLSVAESLADPHLEERKAFVEINHPMAGKMKVSAPWIRFSRTPSSITTPAPLRGEHNRHVLADILGLSASEINALEKEGVVEPAALQA